MRKTERSAHQQRETTSINNMRGALGVCEALSDATDEAVGVGIPEILGGGGGGGVSDSCLLFLSQYCPSASSGHFSSSGRTLLRSTPALHNVEAVG